MGALVVVEAVAIGLLGLLVAGLLRSHAEILRALHQLGAGLDDQGGSGGARPAGPVAVGLGRRGAGAGAGGVEAATDLSGVNQHGEPVRVGVTGTSQDSLLAFLSSGCSTCAGLWRQLATGPGPELGPAGPIRVVVVTRGPEHESRSQVAALAPSSVPLVMSSPAWEAYRVPGAPYFVHVDGRSGRILGQGSAPRWDQVATLVARSAADARLPAEPGTASRVDRDLQAAGIGPGHPSLQHTDVGLGAPEGRRGSQA